MEAKVFIELVNVGITVMLIAQILFAFLYDIKRRKEHYRWARVWLDVITINGIMLVLSQLVYFVFHYSQIFEILFLVVLIWLFTHVLGMRERFNFTTMSLKILEGLKKEVKEVKEKTIQKE